MAGPELIPPELPKLPVALPTPYDAALQSVVVALRAYRELRHRYQRDAKALVEHDTERRQQERIQRKLAERQVSLTKRVKRRLVREHSARAGNPAGPSSENAEALAQRLFMERDTRESTQASATPAPQTRSRFSVMSLMSGAVRASRLSQAQPRSEHAFASLLDARQTAAVVNARLTDFNQRSELALANTQRSFSNAADAFADVETALRLVDTTTLDLSNADRRILRKLDRLIASARMGVTAGQEAIENHRRAQQDDRSVTVSSRGSTVRSVTHEAILPTLNDLQYPGVRESMPQFMQMPTPAQCIAATVSVKAQTSLTQEENIAEGTAQRRVERLVNSLSRYHENVGVLKQHLRENVLAIQAYAAHPGEGAMSVVDNTRASLEAHLYFVRDAVGDVSNRCADLRQIQDPGTLGFAERMADTIGRIDAMLGREIDRNYKNKLDVATFDERFRETPEQQQQRQQRQLRELRSSAEAIQPELKGLLYPEVRDAMPLFRQMPTAAQCIAASAGNTEGLARELKAYEESVSKLGQQLHENTSVIQSYAEAADHAAGMEVAAALKAADPTADANDVKVAIRGATNVLEDGRMDVEKVRSARSDVERQLGDVHAAFDSVRTGLQSFEQSSDADSLEFTRQMRAAVDSIGLRLERELERNEIHAPDVSEIDKEFRAQLKAQQQRAQAPERHIDELQYPEVKAAMQLFKLMPSKQACLAATIDIKERTLLKQNASNRDRTPPQRVERLADALEDYAAQVQILESRLTGTESAARNYADQPIDSTLDNVTRSRSAVQRQLDTLGAAATNVKQQWASFKEIESTDSLEFTKYMKEAVGRIDHRLQREILRNEVKSIDLKQFDAQFRAQRQHLQPLEQDVITPLDSRITSARRRSGLRTRIDVQPSRKPLRPKAGRTFKG